MGLVADIFKGIPTKFIDQFRQRCATESIRELRRHPAPIRYSMVAMFCWRRRQQLTDGLVDMLLQLIHTIGTRAEKKIDKKQFAAFKKVRGKARLLYKVAEATVDQPDGVVKEVVDFCDIKLGKGVVKCKDTPGFIVNRILTFFMQSALNVAVADKVSIEVFPEKGSEIGPVPFFSIKKYFFKFSDRPPK